MTVRAPGRGQMHLAAYLPGVGSAAVGAGPRAGAQVGFSSFERLARTAERGLFDFPLLAEGLRPREHVGGVHDPDEAGRPEPITVLGALAAGTERITFAAAGRRHARPLGVHGAGPRTTSTWACARRSPSLRPGDPQSTYLLGHQPLPRRAPGPPSGRTTGR